MKIIVKTAGISDGSLIKLVWTGYVIGMGIIVFPGILIAALVFVLSPHEGSGFEGILMVVGMPFIVAGFLAAQGIIFGAIIVLGLGIYRKFKGFEIELPGR